MPKKDVCPHAHAAVDPQGKDWKCPKCGSHSPDFYIDDSPNDDCSKLHSDDALRCLKCGWSGSGDDLAKKLTGLKKTTSMSGPRDFVAKHLHALCVELEGWHSTGKLPTKKCLMHELANMLSSEYGVDFGTRINIAEGLVNRAARNAVIHRR